MEAYEVDIRRINTKTSQKLEKEIREKKTTRASLRGESLEERLSSKDDDHDIAWPDLKRVSELDLKRHRLLVTSLSFLHFSSFFLFFFLRKKIKNLSYNLYKRFLPFFLVISHHAYQLLSYGIPHIYLLFQMRQRFIIIFI